MTVTSLSFRLRGPPGRKAARHSSPVLNQCSVITMGSEGPGGLMAVPQLTEKFTEAFDYARVLHAPDVRKGTEIPYLAHLLAVSSIVLENGGTEDQAIGALLHD